MACWSRKVTPLMPKFSNKWCRWTPLECSLFMTFFDPKFNCLITKHLLDFCLCYSPKHACSVLVLLVSFLAMVQKCVRYIAFQLSCNTLSFQKASHFRPLCQFIRLWPQHHCNNLNFGLAHYLGKWAIFWTFFCFKNEGRNR